MQLPSSNFAGADDYQGQRILLEIHSPKPPLSHDSDQQVQISIDSKKVANWRSQLEQILSADTSRPIHFQMDHWASMGFFVECIQTAAPKGTLRTPIHIALKTSDGGIGYLELLDNAPVLATEKTEFDLRMERSEQGGPSFHFQDASYYGFTDLSQQWSGKNIPEAVIVVDKSSLLPYSDLIRLIEVLIEHGAESIRFRLQ